MADTIQTKQCSKCKQILPLTEFHKQKTCKYGFCSSCKKCKHKYRVSEKRRENDKRYQKTENYTIATKKYYNSEKRKITQKIYIQSERGRKIRSKNSKICRQNYPKRIKARKVIANVVRYKKLPPAKSQTCRICFQTATHYHHYLGYEPKHWFDIIPVCASCHWSIHHGAVLKNPIDLSVNSRT